MANRHAEHFASEWAKSVPSIWSNVPMSIRRGDAFRLPAQGRILSVIAEEPRAPLHWLAMVEQTLQFTRVYRLSD